MKKFVLIAFCLTQAACTTPMRMSVNDLANFQIDCSKRNEQYQFLESQKYSELDAIKNAFQMTSTAGQLSNLYNGTLEDSRAALNFEHEAIIKNKQRTIREYCRSEDYTKWQQEEQRKFIEQREQSLR